MTIDYDFHNPDNLTPTQVGDGYRLLLKSEIKKRAFSREIQKWDRLRNDWCKDSLFLGSNKAVTYRVPLATWPLPEADYACPPVKHPEAQELQDRFAEPEWLPWHGGECPLKDDEVEEWEWKLRNGFICGPTNQVVSSLKLDWSWGNNDGDIIAYRVLKWKKSLDKEPAPTDNDTWNSILATNAQLNTKVAELEKDSNFWKSRYETAINAASFIQDEKESLGLLLGQDTITDGIPALRRQRDELQAKLTAAEAQIIYTEDLSSSDGAPTFQQGGSPHEIQEVVTAKMCEGFVSRITELRDRLTAAEARALAYLTNASGGCGACAEGIACGSVSSSANHTGCVFEKLEKAEARLKQLEWVPFSERKPTRKDANEFGWLCATDGKHTCQFKVQNLPIDKRWTHWRPFAPPAPIDPDRVEFEEWWKSHRHTYTTTGKEAVYEIWKAARAKEVKP